MTGILSAMFTGGGGGGYTTGAVSFDGATYLNLDFIVAADTDKISYVYFIKTTQVPDDGIGFGTATHTVWDPQNAYSYTCTEDDYQLDTNYQGDIAGIMYNSDESWTIGNNAPYSTHQHINDGALHCIAMSFDATLNKYCIYIDRAKIYSGDGVPGGSFLFSVSGKDFWVGWDGAFGDGVIASFANMFFMPGVRLADGTGLTIPDATLDLFCNASSKPVDPAAAIATYSPTVFLTRDVSADPATFANNSGASGNLAIFGTEVTGAILNGQNTAVLTNPPFVANALTVTGQSVSGTGIPANTTVTNWDAGTMTVTFSHNATANNPTADLVFGGTLLDAGPAT